MIEDPGVKAGFEHHHLKLVLRVAQSAPYARPCLTGHHPGFGLGRSPDRGAEALTRRKVGGGQPGGVGKGGVG